MSTTAYNPRAADTFPEGSTTVNTTTAERGGSHTHRRISWSAIIGGVVVAVAVQILLSLLGAGIGLGTVDAVAGATPSASGLSIGAGIWWVVSSCVALFIGGYVAAWLAGIEIGFDGMLHGAVTWGLVSLVTLYLLTSTIGSIVGSGFSALGTIASSAGSGVSQAAQPIAQAVGVSPDMIQQQAKAYLQPANPNPATMTPEDAQKAIATDLATYVAGGAGAPAAKERIIAITAAQGKISPEEATRRFDETQAKLMQTRNETVQTAKSAADASAAAASMTAFAGFAVLLLGLIAAAIGGSLAVQRGLTHRTVDGAPVRT